MKNAPWNIPVRVETHRSGPFVFQAGIDLDGLAPLIQRVEDAREFFNKLPAYPEIMARLDHIVLITGIYGTNTIEGGTESNEEIEKIVAMPPEMIKEDSQRRVINLKKAFNIAMEFALGERDRIGEQGLYLIEAMFTDLHRHITDSLKENEIRNNVPGAYRDNPKGLNTKVGDTLHGGVYTAPKCRDDIAILMDNFIKWVNSEPIIALPAVVRAPLVHYYFERIHPFGDGNGRTGRLIESMILKAAGFKYADFLIGKYYNDNFDRYMTLFNECRKREHDKVAHPKDPFVRFSLEGLRKTIANTYDIVSKFLEEDVFANNARAMRDNRKINSRQYDIVARLLDSGESESVLDDIRAASWYKNLYKNRTYATSLRDLKGLARAGLISVDFDKGVLSLKIRTMP